RLRADGRSYLSRRAGARSVLRDTATTRLVALRDACSQSVSVRIGNASGNRLERPFRRQRRQGDPPSCPAVTTPGGHENTERSATETQRHRENLSSLCLRVSVATSSVFSCPLCVEPIGI